MIKEKEIQINGHSSNYKYYSNLGYDVVVRKPFIVQTEDLMPGSVAVITSICDNCNRETRNVFKDYFIYTNGLKNPFYCNKCKVIKSTETCLKKYGVDNPMKSNDVKDILKNSLIDTYGVDHYSKTLEFKEKYKTTCLNKYNSINTFQVNDFKDKIMETNIKKYGVKHYMSLESSKLKAKFNKEELTKLKYFRILKSEYGILSYTNNKFIIEHTKCNYSFVIDKELLYSRIKYDVCICTQCNPIGVQYSSIELEIRNYLYQLNVKYLTGNRKILDGLELDIYIPEFNLAIEVNGLYWHSEIYKEQNYHINKTLLCKEKGIQLLHIWEDDWKLKKDIIKSILLNKLGLLKHRIYARKCLIKEVLPKDARYFLDANHIQGYSSSQLKLGLYYNNELVSLMTFGWRFTNGKKEYELIRFCNKLNYNIIGAASKLFSYFNKNNSIDEIISYADISLFSGGIYEKLGFKKQHLSKPNYFWVVNNIRKHRFNYNKQKLIKEGFDPNKTEVEIMHERGYYRVFSCGQEKWIYKNN